MISVNVIFPAASLETVSLYASSPVNAFAYVSSVLVRVKLNAPAVDASSPSTYFCPVNDVDTLIPLLNTTDSTFSVVVCPSAPLTSFLYSDAVAVNAAAVSSFVTSTFTI